MEKNIDIDRLIALVQNRLTDDEKKELERDIADDEWSRRMLKLFRTMYAHCQPSDFYTPSDKIWNWLIDNSPFLAKPGKVRKPVIAWPKVDVQNIKDIFSIPVFGLQYRTKGVITPELTYETDTHQINLEIFQTDKPGQTKIVGELLTIDECEPVISSRITLERPDHDTVVPQIGQFGDFVFDSIYIAGDDVFDLTIELTDELVFIENVPVGQLSSLS